MSLISTLLPDRKMLNNLQYLLKSYIKYTCPTFRSELLLIDSSYVRKNLRRLLSAHLTIFTQTLLCKIPFLCSLKANPKLIYVLDKESLFDW